MPPILAPAEGASTADWFKVVEEPDGTSATVGADRNREYVRRYRVDAKEPMTEHTAITRFLEAINIGDAHPENPWIFARSIGPFAPKSQDRKSWVGEVKFAPWEFNDEDPLNDPIQVDWGRQAYQEICDQDIDGIAIVNSAGDPYDPPVLRDRTRCVLTITRNEPVFNAALADLYSDTVNAEEFFDCDPGTWKCEGITARNGYKQGFGHYWIVTYVFHFNADGWNARPLDQGLRRKVGSDRAAIIVSGLPAQTPVLLDGSGGVLAPGGTAVFANHQVYPGVDYVLNLGFGASTT